MPSWLPFLFAALVLLALVLAARRATTLLALRVENGEILHQRGRAPGELLRDLADIFRHNRPTGDFALRLEEGRVVVQAPELDAATQQQARNVVARFPTARLKTAPRVGALRRPSR